LLTYLVFNKTASLVFSARQHTYMLSALCALARLFVCLSVRHTGGSVKNG